MLVKPAELYPIEVIVRGILTGSAWREYKKTGSVLDHELLKGMKKNQGFDKPIVTPSTKAEEGLHDIYLTRQQARDIVGPIWDEIGRISLQLYDFGNAVAMKHGAMLADTKFEFGKDANGSLILVDELFTHDSSRFLDVDDYEKAFAEDREPDWIDKQLVRNYAESLGFSGEGEAPKLPDYIIKGAAERVLKVYTILSGEDLPAPAEPPTDERIARNLRNAGLIG